MRANSRRIPSVGALKLVGKTDSGASAEVLPWTQLEREAVDGLKKGCFHLHKPEVRLQPGLDLHTHRHNVSLTFYLRPPPAPHELDTGTRSLEKSVLDFTKTPVGRHAFASMRRTGLIQTR